MEKTTNYQLNQWDASDRVQRTDFNADNAKIDAALAGKADKETVEALTQATAGKAEVVFGSYTGDGAESRVIDLGFTPRALLLLDQDGNTSYFVGSTDLVYGGLMFPGKPLTVHHNSSDNTYIAAQLVENSLEVHYSRDLNKYTFICTNQARRNFYYIAFL